MALFSLNNIKISGVSACVPKNIHSNLDYDWISENDRKTLIKTIGVQERRISPPEITTSDLCFVAAQKLIKELNWNLYEIDLILFVSQSGDYLVPSTSIILQNRLGLSKKCMAFDIKLGCSGFVYGLSVISSFLNNGSIRKALLFNGDKSSFSVSKKDKSTYPLFGDAGTATALEFSTQGKSSYFNLQSDGSGFQNIIIRHGLERFPPKKESLEYDKISKGIERRPIDIELNGSAIFDFALREVIPNINGILNFANLEKDEINYFIFHQANFLINETLRKLMKIPNEKVPYSIHKFGNTSSASIPLTMVTEINKQLNNEFLKLLFCGFGVGLSWGSIIIDTKNIKCLELIEYND